LASLSARLRDPLQITVLIVLASFDHMLLKPWLKSRKALSGRDVGLTRWFFVHSFANLFVCAMAFNSMRAVLTDPFYALDASHYPNTSPFGAGTQWPLTIINSVHVYHMIGGFRLGPADYFHHCLFIPTISFPGQYYKWGPLANFQAFFISGMPGGIDYFLLGLLKLGLISPLFEKRVNSNLNVWLRVPGILLSTMLMYQAVLYGQHQVPLWACILQMVLAPYNALYFGKQASANYAVHFMLDLLGKDELIKKHIEQRTSWTTGYEVMSWKDACGVPQRGS
jgi:hypothetical protein